MRQPKNMVGLFGGFAHSRSSQDGRAATVVGNLQLERSRQGYKHTKPVQEHAFLPNVLFYFIIIIIIMVYYYYYYCFSWRGNRHFPRLGNPSWAVHCETLKFNPFSLHSICYLCTRFISMVYSAVIQNRPFRTAPLANPFFIFLFGSNETASRCGACLIENSPIQLSRIAVGVFGCLPLSQWGLLAAHRTHKTHLHPDPA